MVNMINFVHVKDGEVAQMAERSLSMREVRGSIPCFSNFCCFGGNCFLAKVCI